MAKHKNYVGVHGFDNVTFSLINIFLMFAFIFPSADIVSRAYYL